ncbi:hypothetical protein CR513_15378, partial [Mucuna pruriens]
MSSFMKTWKMKYTWRFSQDSILIMKRTRSKKQNVVAQSSVEAEFQAMEHDSLKRLSDKQYLIDYDI